MNLPTKVKAHEIGFSDHYVLSFKGGLVFANEQDRETLGDYVTAYQEAFRGVATVLSEVVRNPQYREMAYFLLAPSKFPADLATSPSMQDLASEKKAQGGWSQQVAGQDYSLWRTMFGKSQNNDVERALQARMTSYGWKQPETALADAFFKALSPFPAETLRGRLVAAVCGVLRSYLSSLENWGESQREKAAMVGRLTAQYPVFFKRMEALAEEQSLWRQCCRILETPRVELMDRFKKAGVKEFRQKTDINQRLAMAAQYPGSVFAVPPHEKALALKDDHAINALRGQLPAVIPSPEYPRDRFECIGRPGHPKKFALSPYAMCNLLRCYNEQFHEFTDTEMDTLLKVTKYGPKSVLTGWVFPTCVGVN